MMTVTERTMKFMNMPTNQWPDGLTSYVKYRIKGLGICSEVVLESIRQFCTDVPEGEEWEHNNFDKELERRDEENKWLKAHITHLNGELERWQERWSERDRRESDI